MTWRKRIFDLFFASLLVVILGPVLLGLLIWLLIREGRPLFYVAERMKGVDQPFDLWKLRTMSVVIKGPDGELDKGQGSDVLEHPLNAVIWLAQDLARQGKSLRKGDYVSVGSFSKLLPPKPGMKVEVQYMGLPGNPVVGVTFK